MNATSRPRLRGAVGLLAGAVVSLIGGLLGGVPGARMSVATVVLIATAIAVTRLGTATVDRPPAYPTGRTTPPTGYPTYNEIVRKLSWADSSPTYTTRVLRPWLRELGDGLGVDDMEIDHPNRPIVDLVERLEGELGDATR